ncbi:Lipid transfer protein [Quillaja saponaria]|uniref:Lipid transfer protein n=1 Tax=Quillaja saponaria TaxID=32244 RepID=A0AAD7Q3W7_QUISA|nr:Lipid transfer protein [Quillaja saponaria]
MAFQLHSTKTALSLAYILLLMSCAVVDSAKEAEECVRHLSGLASCVTYIFGESKAPATECCSGIKKAFKNDEKCMCLILKDYDHLNLGPKYNLTHALGLASACRVPNNFSQCIALLHLDPKSPEAQVFNQMGKVSDTGGSASSNPAPSPTVEGSTSNPRKSIAKNAANCYIRKRFLGFEVLVGGILLRYF